MARTIMDLSREHHAHALGCYRQFVSETKRQQQRSSWEDDIPDERRILRVPQSYIREKYLLSPLRHVVFVLNEDILDDLADRYRYSKLYLSQSAPMASYRRGPCRLNFWLTTGAVGSYLNHPRRGNTQLFHRDVDMSEAESIFRNPRVHTDRGYRKKENSEFCF